MSDGFDPQDPLDASYEGDRARLLEAMLRRAANEGWCRTALDHAAQDAGLAPERMALIFPDGVLDVLAYDSARLDRAMVAALTPQALEGLRVRARVALGLKTRIEALGAQEAAAHRAAALLALPPFAPYGVKLALRTVDALWRAIGDSSTDFNFYTKRGMAAAVYLATLASWFADKTPDKAQAWITLEAQIDRIMMIEGTKLQLRKFAQLLPSPWPLLGLLRYPGRTEASVSEGRAPSA